MRISTSTGYKTSPFSPQPLWDPWGGSLSSKSLVFKRIPPSHLGLPGHFWSKVTEAQVKQAYEIYWEEFG